MLSIKLVGIKNVDGILKLRSISETLLKIFLKPSSNDKQKYLSLFFNPVFKIFSESS